jgi:glutamate racemase
MSIDQRPIGIFDSGIGGLTVASAILERMPDEALMYFGDTVHMPYGEKSEANIIRYSLRIARFLLDHNAKAIVIACNSASAVAADLVSHMAGDKVPVINVIDPLVHHLDQFKEKRRIGVIGTKATIRSQVYPKRIHRQFPGVKVQALATPLLAPLVEEGFANTAVSHAALESYLSHPALRKIQCLLLACTHYPLLHEEVSAFYQNKVEVFDSARLAAESVYSTLLSNGLLNTTSFPHQHQFFVSEYTEAFETNAQRFFGQNIQLNEVHIHENS